ncbi:MAG: hypothetical protein WCC41_09840 [Rhodomicrobium sp.]
MSEDAPGAVGEVRRAGSIRMWWADGALAELVPALEHSLAIGGQADVSELAAPIRPVARMGHPNARFVEVDTFNGVRKCPLSGDFSA